MSNLWLTVEVPPGAGIEQTCADAVALAARTGLSIWFNFNGVKCLAREGDDPRRIEEAWVIALKRPPGPARIASDNGERAKERIMDDKQLIALIGRVDVETPGVPMAGLLRDEVRVGAYQARLLAIARAVQAAERERCAVAAKDAEIGRLRSALEAIKKHCEPQPSALAAAIVATCDSGLGA